MSTIPRRGRTPVPARTPSAPAALAAAVLLLSACTGGGQASGGETSSSSSSGSTASSSGTASSGSAAPSSATASASSAPGGAGAGCAPTTEQVPGGAATAPTADLDHDGRTDELWLADTGGERLVGVRTASGAVFSTAYASASPIATTAIGQVLDAATSVVLLSDGRQVPLFAVTTDAAGCALVATQNAQGEQYAFDLGFTGYGSGVACVPPSGSGDDLALYGLLVRGGDVEGDLPLVERTRIELSDGGRQARNGPTDSPAELAGIDPEGPQVAAAREVRCGDQGPDTAVSEPA